VSGRPESSHATARRLAWHVAAGRRVVGHLDQSGDAAVNKRAVADHAHNAAGLVGREHVAEPEPNINLDICINRFERRRGAEGVAADIASDDALEPPERREDGTVGASRAEGGRLAAGRLGLGPGVAGDHARYPRHGKLAEAVHPGVSSRAIPAARIDSASTGSPSSITRHRATLRANWRIVSIGRG
jgi:hypothetical protein